MPSNRDEAIGGYVRSRLRDLEATRERGWQVEFARIAGFVPSVVAQVKRGLGVGAKTGPGFARALGFKTFDDLKSAAYRWWESEGRPQSASHVTTGAAFEAMEAVLALGHGSRDQLRAILSAYEHPRFANRDRGWWIQTLLGELRADADAEIETRLAGRPKPRRTRAPAVIGKKPSPSARPR